MTMSWSGTIAARRRGPLAPLPPSADGSAQLAAQRLNRLRAAGPTAVRHTVAEAAAESAPWQALEPMDRGTRRRLAAAIALALTLVAAAGWTLRPHASHRAAPPAAAVSAAGLDTALPAGPLYGPPLPSISGDEAVSRVLAAFGGAPSTDEAGTTAAVIPAPSEPAASGWGRAPAQADESSAPSDGWTRGDGATAPAQAITAATAVAPDAPRPAAAPVIWPAVGPITSYFGPSHPLGIDIGVNLGTPLRAIAPGRIAFAGGDACCSYGYYVDVDHGNGVMTRYGHLLYVPALPVGTPVRQGDIIGLSGNTGYSTGPHLHFEVRLYGSVVDPLRVLPSQ